MTIDVPVKEKKVKVTKVKKMIQEAEFNAKKRDEMDLNGGYTQSGIDEMQENATKLINELEAATGKTIGLFNTKPKSKVRFAQVIQENVQYLVKNKLLTNAEKAFLFDITGFITFKSNGIGIQKKGEYIPFLQKDIAEAIGKAEKNLRPILKSLQAKGIICEARTSIEGLNSKGCKYIMNPNIIYNGDKNEIEETLKFIFSDSKSNEFLKNLPVKLF